jgi:hypothetical protein
MQTEWFPLDNRVEELLRRREGSLKIIEIKELCVFEEAEGADGCNRKEGVGKGRGSDNVEIGEDRGGVAGMGGVDTSDRSSNS